QVVSSAHQLPCIDGLYHRYLLGRGHDFNDPSVAGLQAIPATQHGAAWQRQSDLLAILEARQQAAALAQFEWQDQARVGPAWSVSDARDGESGHAWVLGIRTGSNAVPVAA